MTDPTALRASARSGRPARSPIRLLAQRTLPALGLALVLTASPVTQAGLRTVAGGSEAVPTPVLLTSAAGDGATLVLVGPRGDVEAQPATVTLQGLRPSAVAAAGDGWIVAGVRELPDQRSDPAPGAGSASGGERMALALVAGDPSGAVREIVAPAVSGRLLLDPEPVVGVRGLDGLAWLQGTERGRLAVRYARRVGDGWGAVETVAALGPGSQLALAAASLEDGSTLLVWSRFDGEDDEIVWSLRAADGKAGWSPPRRIGGDDAVPDVTPAVAAVPGGAVVTWSGFDGDGYRIFAARFDGTAWSEPRPVSGPGAVLPSFAGAPRGSGGSPSTAAPALPAVIYRTASPRGWAVAELEPTAEGAVRPARTARVESGPGAASPQRPVVAAADGAGVVLVWPAVADSASSTVRSPGAGESAGPTTAAADAPLRVAVPWTESVREVSSREVSP